MDFRDTEFGYEDVILDGHRFERCRFSHSRLLFRGEALPTLHECVIGDDVELILGGSAKLTVQLLSLLYHASNGSGAQAIERLLDNLRRGEFQ